MTDTPLFQSPDGDMVAGDIHHFQQDYTPNKLFLMLVENVSTFACSAEVEVEEHAKVALRSVAEGGDNSGFG